jgi:uncharacterized protein YhaN
MRLTAIEALRYGALEEGCLSGLGDGLSVVLGPNESGKSTFTALTRHVLYGYPDARTKERGYQPPAGNRDARLVFASAEGEWAIERSDGPRRGPVSVVTRQGAERPGLLGEVVEGVSEQTFRVVFGFGLDELAEIERQESADVVARLYAAGTGLSVNPIDVRAELEAQAGKLWAPRAQKPRVNAVVAETKAVREQIRELEALAIAYAGDQRRMTELEETLEPLRARRDELEERVLVLQRDLQRASDGLEQANTLKIRIAEIDADVLDTERALSLLVVDEAALESAPTLAAVLEDASAFRQLRDAIATSEAAAAEFERQAVPLRDLPATAADSPVNRATVERWRDRLAEGRREAETSERVAAEAEARARAHADIAAEAGVVTRRALPITAIILLVLGIIGAAAGLVAAQWLAVALGVAVAGAGAVLLLLRPRGAETPPLDAEAARLEAEARAKRELATEAREKADRDLAEWRAWLAEHGLDAYGDDPVSVRELFEALRERARLAGEAQRCTEDAGRARSDAEAWVIRLVDVARRLDESDGQIPDLNSAFDLAANVRTKVDRAVEADAERRTLTAALDTLRSARSAAGTQLAEQEKSIARSAAAHGVEHEADPLPLMEALATRLAEDVAEVREQYDALWREVSELRGKLDREGRDAAMALARQRLESLRAQAAQAADGYVVTATAVRLLDLARERFERDRQPEVVRTAARVFSAMTAGRYRDLRVPLDGSGITVVASDGTVRPTTELSRGTAEQLYLALRVGLISSLKGMGQALPVLMDDIVVNFDAERRAGAVSAIAELAARRQVIFFTCHEETATLLLDTVAGSTALALDRCSL